MPTPVPSWIEPMAATLTRERFEDPAWVFEKKLDGIRLLTGVREDKLARDVRRERS